MSRFQVLHVDCGRSMRGGQWQVLRLLKAHPQGAILLSPDRSPLMQRAREQGIDVRPFTPSAVFRLSRRADVTHAHDARAHTWCAMLARRPLVVSRRVAFAVRSSAWSRWKYSQPDRYIAISEHVKTRLRAAGIPETKISIVRDGVPVPDRIARGSHILTPTSDDPRKKTSLAHEAASLTQHRLSFSSDLERDLPEAALFVYLSDSEGLGSATLFAMAYGVAVVASDVGGLPEAVEDGITGILTPNEPGAVASAIDRAWEQREQMGARARARVLAGFTVAHMVEGTFNVYRSVTQGYN